MARSKIPAVGTIKITAAGKARKVNAESVTGSTWAILKSGMTIAQYVAAYKKLCATFKPLKAKDESHVGWLNYFKNNEWIVITK